jgi:hypothetical protein
LKLNPCSLSELAASTDSVLVLLGGLQHGSSSTS